MALREVLAFFGFELDTSELDRGNNLTDQFKDKLLGVGKAVAGAFAVERVVSFSKELINQADELREAAIALGAVPQQLQVLEFAAGQAGVEVGELRASLAKFNKTAAESAGGKGASATFKKLGVDLKNADGTIKSSGQLFEEAGAAIGRVEDPIERAGLASDLFGKSYAKLLPLFAEGEEGMKKAREEAEALGFVFDDAFLERSDEINDNLTKVKKGLVGLAVQALAPLLADVLRFTQRGVATVKMLVGWARNTNVLRAATILLTARGLIAMVRAVTAIVARFGGWRAVMARLLPLILRVVAPIAALDDILAFMAGKPSALGLALNKAFGPGTAKAVRETIFAIGRFFALFKSKPEEVRAAFAKLPEDLKKMFGSFGSFLGGWGQQIVNVALFAVNTITGGWENAAAKLKAVWDGLGLVAQILWTEVKFGGLAAAAALADAWDNFLNGFREKVDTLIAAAGFLASVVPGGAPALSAAQGLLVAGKAAAGGKTGAPSALSEVEAQRTQARLELAGKGDALAARLTAPARATAPAGNTTSTTTVNAPVTTTVNQSISVSGDVKPGTVNRIGKAAKGGAGAALDLSSAKAATSYTSG